MFDVNGNGEVHPAIAHGGSGYSIMTNFIVEIDPSEVLLAGAGVLEEEDLDSSTVQWLSQRGLMPEDFESDYGLLAPEDAVIIRPYGGEDDDILLHELRPRFVVMYEPNLAFIRRLEVSSTT